MDEALQGAVLVFIPKARVCPQGSPQTNIFRQVGKLVYIRCTVLVAIQFWEEVVEVTKHLFCCFNLCVCQLTLQQDVHCNHKQGIVVPEEWWKMREKQREGVDDAFQ